MIKKLVIASLLGVFASSLFAVAPASAGSFCNNGSYSSNSGRGTCSYNGGVNKNFPSYSDPGSSSYKRNYGLNSTPSYGYKPAPSYGFNSSPSYGLNNNKSLGNSYSNNYLNSNKSCRSLRC